MSAPDGDLERQAKHHRGPLRGMFAVVLFAVVLLALLAFWAFGRGGDLQGAGAQVQEGTGAAESGQANDAITANDRPDEEQGAGTQGEADPTAVTVPAETVTAPEVGAGNVPDTDPGESQAAEPLNPVDDAEEGGAVSTEESQNE
jgi:hypothetical protein